MSRTTARSAAMQMIFEKVSGGQGGEETLKMVYDELRESGIPGDRTEPGRYAEMQEGNLPGEALTRFFLAEKRHGAVVLHRKYSKLFRRVEFLPGVVCEKHQDTVYLAPFRGYAGGEKRRAKVLCSLF